MQYMVESQEVMDVLQILRRVREALIYSSFRRKPESSALIKKVFAFAKTTKSNKSASP